MKKKNERFGEGKKIFKVGLRIIDIIVDIRESCYDWLSIYIELLGIVIFCII